MSPFPTVSAAPSLLYSATLKANVAVHLKGMDTKMNATHTAVLESVTKFFLQQTLLTVVEGAVLITSVVVVDQSVVAVVEQVEGTPSPPSPASSWPSTMLQVELRVVAEYESLVHHPDELDFPAILQAGFRDQAALFRSNLLDSGDAFFAPLDPAYHRNIDKDHGPLSKGGYIALIVVSIVVSLMAMCAAYYAVQRKKEESNKGDKLSEMNGLYDDAVGSSLSQDDQGVSLKYSKSMEIIQVTDGTEQDDDDTLPNNNTNGVLMKAETPQKKPLQDADKNTIEVVTIGGNSRDGSSYAAGRLPPKSNNNTRQQQQQQHQHQQVVMSPNTMENGSNSRLGSLAESILRSDSFGSNRDPPESSGYYKYAPKVSKGDPAANYRTAAAVGLPRPGSMPPPPSSRVRVIFVCLFAYCSLLLLCVKALQHSHDRRC